MIKMMTPTNRYAKALRYIGWGLILASFSILWIRAEFQAVMNPNACPVGITCETPNIHP